MPGWCVFHPATSNYSAALRTREPANRESRTRESRRRECSGAHPPRTAACLAKTSPSSDLRGASPDCRSTASLISSRRAAAVLSCRPGRTRVDVRIAGHAVVTPLIESPALSERVGARVLVKAETLQRVGAFKFRGGYNALAQFTPTPIFPGPSAQELGLLAQLVTLAQAQIGALFSVVGAITGLRVETTAQGQAVQTAITVQGLTAVARPYATPRPYPTFAAWPTQPAWPTPLSSRSSCASPGARRCSTRPSSCSGWVRRCSARWCCRA